MFNLSDKTFNTLSKIQKVLLVIMAIASIIVEILIVLKARDIADFGLKIINYNFALTNLVFAIAMICGFIYVNKGYSKQANGYYKAMMCFYAFSFLVPVVTLFRVSVISPDVLVAILKTVLLLILAFGKDLGKKNTWIIFYSFLVLEMISGPMIALIPEQNGITPVFVFSGYSFSASIARLVIAGVLGLCIEAKYRDKDARGTI